MLRSLLGPDWRKSPAHLLLLSKFLQPPDAQKLSEADYWKPVLKEAPDKAIKRFVDEGMLLPASLSGLLSYRYKVDDLKPLLKERGLSKKPSWV